MAHTATAPGKRRPFMQRMRRWLRRSASERAEPALRVKLALVMMVSMVTGVLVGLMEAAAGHRSWPMTLALGGALLVLWALARGWVLAPVERLVQQAERLAAEKGKAAAARRLRPLPIDRADEVGRLARCLHQLGTAALQSRHEARALRRDMHRQVARSTQRATHELRRMAHRDPLTELGNRRCMDELLPELIERAQAAEKDVLCVAIDLDNFKQINDTLGHARGDEALCCLAQLLKASVRPGDLAVRLGGDEFVLFLPGARFERVRGLTAQVRDLFRQRMRSLLASACWGDLSIGVASMRRDGCADARALLDKADAHLYHAKHEGKGQCYGVEALRAVEPDTPMERLA